jgi:hypothetical protein
MQIIDTDTQIDINIESPLLVLEYTADADREIYAQVYLSEIVGNGSYRACITKKPIGSAIFYQSPTSAVFVKLGTTNVYLNTTIVPVVTGDVVRIYVQGLTGDLLSDCVVDILDNTINSSDIVNAIENMIIEGTFTFQDSMKIVLAVLSGKVSGGGTNLLKFRDLSDALDRLIATVDENGNRTNITLDLS